MYLVVCLESNARRKDHKVAMVILLDGICTLSKTRLDPRMYRVKQLHQRLSA
jgi:hypothetical protein